LPLTLRTTVFAIESAETNEPFTDLVAGLAAVVVVPVLVASLFIIGVAVAAGRRWWCRRGVGREGGAGERERKGESQDGGLHEREFSCSN